MIAKTGYKIEEPNQVEVVGRGGNFVGRGAQKMIAALEVFQVDPKNKVVADVGASTGGFTQVLLQHGAKKVYAIDVGHNQLAQELKNDSRVINLEGVNIRHGVDLPEKVDLVVADLSFISLKLVVESMRQLAQSGADFILLFKPQFEVGKEGIGKNGIVKNDKVRKKALDHFLKWCRSEHWTIKNVIESPVVGKAGNKEILLHLNS